MNIISVRKRTADTKVVNDVTCMHQSAKCGNLILWHVIQWIIAMSYDYLLCTQQQWTVSGMMTSRADPDQMEMLLISLIPDQSDLCQYCLLNWVSVYSEMEKIFTEKGSTLFCFELFHFLFHFQIWTSPLSFLGCDNMTFSSLANDIVAYGF